ncbi:MAG TPA: hypothetical protein VKP30_16150, partial [Polyangiaceae bacterium]|nr:hypothetical protein [Polyangiaceae bacterium]
GQAAALILIGLAVCCSGVSNSEQGDAPADELTVNQDTASGGSSAANSTKSSVGLTTRIAIGGASHRDSGASSRSGGSSNAATPTDFFAEGGSSGANDKTGVTTSNDGCPGDTTWTEAVRFLLKSSWPATSAAVAGAADIEVLALVKLSVDGDKLVGTTRGCRTVMPPAQLSAAGQIVTGGTTMLTDLPDAVWDAPSMGTADCAGKQSGSGISSHVEYGWTALIGVTLSDAHGAWPASGAGLKTDDADGDGNPGITSVPKNGGGYVLPPTGLGILGSAPTADKVYVVNRNIISLSGTRSSCDEHAGTASFPAFDNHVVGCHTKNGACSASQVDFCDQNRPLYKINSATYSARRVPESTTCAEVRALFSS